MGCSVTGYRTCLIFSNVVILFVGVSVLLLGLKMEGAVGSLVGRGSLPLLEKTVHLITAAGAVLGATGASGFIGACYEMLWLLFLHILGLIAIIIVQFGVGVTIFIVKRTIIAYLESPECNNTCATALDNIVLDYALPSAGLMMTIIIVEAFMIYSAMRLYISIKSGKKCVQPIGNQIVVQNVQMQSVPSPHPVYIQSGAQPMYNPNASFMDPSVYQPQFPVSPLSPRPPPSAQHQMPPAYNDVMPRADSSSVPQYAPLSQHSLA